MSNRDLFKSRELTQERLREFFSYDPDTGLFTSIKKRWGSKFPVGSVVGSPTGNGLYLEVRFDYRPYYLHRLAWFYMTGKWPDPEVDHEDGDGFNNRWRNLRETGRAGQMQNRACRNSTGFPGVYRVDGSWAASITLDYQKHYLGCFPTPELAHAAYIEAKAHLHTFNPTVRDLPETAAR